MSRPGPLRYVVQVSAGTGPVEACAFVGRLAPRIQALCIAAGLVIERVTPRGGAASAPRSIEILVRGDAPAALRAEIGTHALISRSDRRGRAARKRWFTAVTVHAAAPEGAEGAGGAGGAGATAGGARPVVRERDIEVRAVRASGPGGQNVNKVATAVRALHAPSGIEVKVSDERSQRANVRLAVQRITSRLAARADDAKRAARSDRRAAHYRVERGAPVRTYRDGPRGELLLEGAEGASAEDDERIAYAQ